MLFDPNQTRWVVSNFGAAGTTASRNADYPYWDTVEYELALRVRAKILALESYPDAVVLMFGSNDAKLRNWDAEAFASDLADLARSFTSLESSPSLYLMVPPPAYGPAYDIS